MAGPTPELLRGIHLFEDLDEKTLRLLSKDFIEREFEEGTNIAVEGETGLNFFVVESGSATVSINGKQVGTLGPGNSFGEVALVDKSARSATITATSYLRAWALPIWSFRSFVESRPAVSWKLLEMLSEMLRRSNTR
jgi:CRP-like cAMP-binding protein